MNKEELESMSEGELSAEVLRSIALKNDGYVVAGVRHNGSMALANVKVGKVMTGISFDINNWSDMGPLIDIKGISLIWHEGDNEASAMLNPVCGDGGSIYSDFDCYHENILRAAAIVYLLIMESE